MNKTVLLAGLLVMAWLTACDQPAPDKPLQYSTAPAHEALPTYHLVPHPLYNPQTLSQIFQPLVTHLNLNLQGCRIELEASRDYQAFEQKFRARDADILMPNPWQTIEAQKVGYHVIAMWGDAEDFKGLFIVRARTAAFRHPLISKEKPLATPRQQRWPPL